MSQIIESIERAQLRKVPAFQPGDRVRVHFQVVEGNRRRTQVFEGVVLRRQGNGVRETFTVRKLSFGVGVERTFPVHSPKIEKIEIAARGDVRRAKLYYLRGRVGRAARVRERRFDPAAAAEVAAQEAALKEQQAAEVLAGEEVAAETISPETEPQPVDQPDGPEGAGAEGPQTGADDLPETQGEADDVAATQTPEPAEEIPGDAGDAPEASDSESVPDEEAPTADADKTA